MIFTTKIEYGVMMLTVLARQYGQGPLSLSEVADELGLSAAYLEQIVPNLRRAGFIESVRGAKGGYRLTKAPITIRMGAVIGALEDRKGGIIGDDEGAEHSNPLLWRRVREAIRRALDATSLADLTPTGPRTPIPLSRTLELLQTFDTVDGVCREGKSPLVEKIEIKTSEQGDKDKAALIGE